jgi:hygromycin-B 7''-O-kinase
VPYRALTVDQAGTVLSLVRPGAAVTDVVARTGGRLSTVYEVRYAGSPDAVIVKIYAEPWRWKLAKEVHVYGILGDHGAGPVPTILHAEHGTGLIGSAFTVMTRLAGRPLSEVIGAFDAGEIRTVYRQLGAALSAVHRIGQDAYGYLTTHVLDPVPDNTAYMTRQFAKKLREFTELGGDPALHDLVQAHVAERVASFARCVAPRLCHNDLHEGNVLVAREANGWTLTGFIDVENAVAADPLLDLAKTDYYAIRGDEAKMSGFLDGYGPLPHDGTERVRLYRLYHALELWDWFASIGDLAPLPGIADDLRALTARP